MNGNSPSSWQEPIALAIVAFTVFWIVYRGFRKKLAKELSERLLRAGHVKWAMRLRFAGKKAGKSAKCH